MDFEHARGAGRGGTSGVIDLVRVWKEYPGAPPALADVSLRIERGEFVFLTGPSGAGKSTLMRLVFRADTATRGALAVFGRDLADVEGRQVAYLRRKIGVVFQDFKLLPDRTVAENVALPLEVRGLVGRDVRRRALETLDAVGLSARADALPLSLSGGEQQRVSVARALVGSPALVLADEPTGNLDPDRTLEVMDLLQAANAKGTSVVVATHDRSLLERYGRRVVALERGRVVGDTATERPAVAR